MKITLFDFRFVQKRHKRRDINANLVRFSVSFADDVDVFFESYGWLLHPNGKIHWPQGPMNIKNMWFATRIVDALRKQLEGQETIQTYLADGAPKAVNITGALQFTYRTESPEGGRADEGREDSEEGGPRSRDAVGETLSES